MKISIMLLAILLALAPLARGDESPATMPSVSGKLGNPVQLFNGKNINDWVCYTRAAPTTTSATRPDDPTPYWFVKDEILHDVGNPYGYLRTKADYDNYVLTVEQRHVNKGNGGVFIGITGQDAIWPRELEMQGMVGEEGDIRGISGFKLTSDPTRTDARHIKRIGPSSEKPVGEWETIRVIVDHGHLSLYVNAVLQNETKYDGNLKGHIGLQAEGGEMEFRKVELREIGDAR